MILSPSLGILLSIRNEVLDYGRINVLRVCLMLVLGLGLLAFDYDYIAI